MLASTFDWRGLLLCRDEPHQQVPLGAERSSTRVRGCTSLASHERAVFDIDRAQPTPEPVELVHLILV